LPAALLLMFGVIDVGRYAWQLNEYEKAVQLGTRYAVATQVVPGALNTADFSGKTCGSGKVLTAGDTICTGLMQTIVCTNTSCSCVSGTGTDCYAGNYNSVAFTNIFSRMRVATSRIAPAQVQIVYSDSGIGYVGDPAIQTNCSETQAAQIKANCSLPDISPIVTVRLTNQRYYPITLSLLKSASVPYPDFSFSLTLEDGDGTVAS